MLWYQVLIYSLNLYAKVDITDSIWQIHQIPKVETASTCEKALSVKCKDRLDGHVHGVEAVVLEHDLKQNADQFHLSVSSQMR